VAEWRDQTLGEVLTLQRGFDLPARDRVDGPVPIVSSSGVTGHHAVGKVEPPGVVIGRYGTLGQVHWVTERYWPLNTALWVRDFKGNDPRFVSYLLRTVSTDGSAASAVPGVNRNHLHRLPVRVPSVRTQRRIAAMLAAFDDLIAINERRIGLLNDLARSLYREWFVRLRFPGHEIRDASASGAMPNDWETVPLGDVAHVNASTVRAQDLPDPLRYLDISALGPRRLGEATPMDAASAPGRARRRVQDGDTLWSTVRPNRRAHALIHDPPDDLIVSNGLATLTPTCLPASFLFEYSSSPAFTEYLVTRATGSAYPAVRPVDFEEAPIVVPPADTLEAFDRIVGPAHRMVSALGVLNRGLAATRDILLPRLVTGGLEVADIDLGVLLADVEDA
jgi:type I restriction enzyme S subunit